MTKARIFSLVLWIFRTLLSRKDFFKLNKAIFLLSLRGLGILNYENDKISGERSFIKNLSIFLASSRGVFVDVGANIGNYSKLVRSVATSIDIYAFEPHPKTFNKLKSQSKKNNYVTINAACGDAETKLRLYDYGGEKSGSSHASLYQDAIKKIRQERPESWEVNVTTIDTFIKKYKINRISLLKIDTEGNELKVLYGAKESIRENIVDIIHLEFNEMNVFSRVFMKDIYDALENYSFYRMLPDGLVCLGEYHPVTLEIFAYQNIVAIRKDIIPQVQFYLHI